jgi:hypothetical protein
MHSEYKLYKEYVIVDTNTFKTYLEASFCSQPLKDGGLLIVLIKGNSGKQQSSYAGYGLGTREYDNDY